eukprot:CAMPEP_0202734424 /NCGR_PEP_ID=MMETSP1385-20130828/188675_1 /ASSEMBLY_ACC=CAM_ASM_000861 /TAXON_ID=933848 /ORGANISM="Elphidium margaritaceum" /LENGTH=467 /DNA_ID=CAMNT_0049400785 /DNA_START=329 /DNA_END=1732 /DNA_ORIENTATION=-
MIQATDCSPNKSLSGRSNDVSVHVHHDHASLQATDCSPNKSLSGRSNDVSVHVHHDHASLQSELEKKNVTQRRQLDEMQQALEQKTVDNNALHRQIQEKDRRIQNLQTQLNKVAKTQTLSTSAQLLSGDDDDSKQSKSRALCSELQFCKSENQKLKDRLQQIAFGVGEMAFIREEDFANEKYSPFRQQTLQTVHDEVVEHLMQEYQGRLDVSDDDMEDEDAMNDDEEMDPKPKFELLMDRMASEFLFELLLRCYERMKQRKLKICDIVARQLSIADNANKRATAIAEVMIHPQLQQQWSTYLTNAMPNVFEIHVPNITTVVEEIFHSIVTSATYRDWQFLNGKMIKKQIEKSIRQALEICWIMILTKPQMEFYPSSFRMFAGQKESISMLYNKKQKHELWTGSKTNDNAKMVYFAVPAVVQTRPSSSKQHQQQLLVVEGQAFVHNNDALIEYVMSHPNELLDNQPDL